ncbi:MAG TPA: hypothetical protein VHL09_05865 [Dehalococcoidia bacterium]|nr:hypothetical protein [Dehalococcoidia bacterium]
MSLLRENAAIETGRRAPSIRWDLLQALLERGGEMTDTDLASATGQDLTRVREAIDGLAIGGVVEVTRLHRDPWQAPEAGAPLLVCRSRAI